MLVVAVDEIAWEIAIPLTERPRCFKAVGVIIAFKCRVFCDPRELDSIIVSGFLLSFPSKQALLSEVAMNKLRASEGRPRPTATTTAMTGACNTQKATDGTSKSRNYVSSCNCTEQPKEGG